MSTADRSREDLERELGALRLKISELERGGASLHTAIFESLRDLAPRLTERRELGEILHNLLVRVGSLVQTEHAFVALADQRDESMILRYGIGAFEDHDVRNMKRGEGLAGQVWAKRSPLIVEDYASWGGRSDRIPKETYRSVAGVPLDVAGETIGVLGVALVDPDRTFNDRDIEMLKGIAEVAAVAIDNARLLEDETRARNEAERLLAAAESISESLDLDEVLRTILEELGKVVPYDSASVQELKDEELEIIGGVGLEDAYQPGRVRFSLGDESIPNGRVLSGGEPLIVNDTSEYPGFNRESATRAEIRSWLGVPLKSRDEMLGMIALAKKEGDFYQPRHARLAHAFSQQASLAIQNARLFSAVKHELAKRMRVEERLAQAEVSYKTLVEQLPAIVYQWSIGTDPASESETAYISPQVMTFLGYSQKEWLDDPDLWWRVIHPEDRDRVTTYLSKKDEAGYDVNILHRLVSKDGRVLWFQNQSRTLKDESGRPKETHGLMLDVTELKRTEEELRELFEEVIAARGKAEDRAEQLEGLNRVAITLGAVRDLQSSLAVVARDTAILFHASAVAIAFLEEPGEQFEFVAEHRVKRVASLIGGKFPIAGNPLLEKLVRSTRPFVFTRDMYSLMTSATRRYLQERRVDSILFVPLIVRSEIIAELMIECDSLRPFRPTELQLAETIGSHVASAIATARLLEEMQSARDAADAASRAKSEFLANMSHEIRTPMNAVIGMTGLLLDSSLTPAQREFAETIRQSGEVMLTLINDILDFSKIEAGRLELESQAFDIFECIESVLDLFATRSAQKGLEIGYLVDEGVPAVVRGDATRLRQVLVNLVGNAVKFTERGSVLVAADLEAESDDSVAIHFEVRDTGVGIPEERMDRLFRSFSQVDPSTTRRFGGTGLGLAISSRLAELMGGRMWVASEPDKGSSFHFVIRCEAAPSAPRMFMRHDQPIMAGRTMLVISARSVTTDIIDRWAETWGLSVIVSEDPVPAREALEAGNRVDLLVVDVDDVAEADRIIQMLRDAARTPALPAIVISPMGSRPEETESHTLAYLSRPIKPSSLYNLVLAFIVGDAPTRQRRKHTRSYDTHMGESHPLRVLVAEDNSVNQRLAVLTLEHLGYRADIAANGLEALEALRRQRYDVVLMDVQMPELDGLEATRRIRAGWPPDRRPRIVAMTANAMLEDREACFEAGMDAYLSKPLKIEDLVGVLRNVSESLGENRPGAGGLDTEKLQELEGLRHDGRPSILDRLLSTYLRDTPALIQSLTDAIADEDPVAMAGAAHSLKGSSLTIGATRLGDYARQLEELGREQTCDGAEGILERMKSEMERVRSDAAHVLEGKGSDGSRESDETPGDASS